MCDGFINAAKDVFERGVKIVIDRFHVAKLYRSCVDDLRKTEMKRLQKELPDEEYKKLKKNQWLVRKAWEELDDDETEELNQLFEYSPLLKLAYEFSNELTAIFDQDISKPEARKKINDWMHRVKQNQVGCFDTFLLTLKKYKNKILNYFDGRHTSGFVEGLNNRQWFQRLYLDIEGYERFA
jgi:transposase